MEQSLLNQQSQERGIDTNRLTNLMNTSGKNFFQDWTGKANDLYDKQLNDYLNNIQLSAQKKLGQGEEGVSILSASPAYYEIGKGVYNVAPKILQKPLDIVGEKIASSDIGQTIGEGAGNITENIGRAVGRAGDFVLDSMRTPEPVSYSSSSMTTTPPEGVETTNISNEANEANLLETNAVTNAESGVETGAETGAETLGELGELGAVETSELPVEEALASTGYGAPLAGAIAVGTAIGFGIDELFKSHHNNNNTPSPNPPSVPPAMTNRYNVSSILPNINNLSTTPNLGIF